MALGFEDQGTSRNARGKKSQNRPNHSGPVTLKMGELYVTEGPEVISTVLGSCVAACVRDRVYGIGGMNHFMLPNFSVKENNVWEYTSVNTAARYGAHAMEFLINKILEKGGKRNNLEFKLFGGGDILGIFSSVGQNNVRFIREYMDTEGYGIAAECLGASQPIKVNYCPATGVAKIKRLEDKAVEIAAVEKTFLHELQEQEVGGDVELF